MIMKMKTKYILFGIGILITVLLIFLFVKIIPLSEEQNVFISCIGYNWETDFCKDYWENNYADGRWTKKCSTWFFFTDKISCHDLCNVDCEFYNKEEGEFMCVC